MRITMLGTGAALPDPNRGHSSILITIRNNHYLIDCGHGATRQLIRANVDPSTVNTVFLSHLHYDHIEDLAYFLISSWICDRQVKPTVVGPPGTKEFVSHLLEDGAFSVDIKARAQYPQRGDTIEMIRPEIRIISPGLVYEDQHIRVYADYVEHIPSDTMHCFGLRIEAEGKIIAFSGDTAPCESMISLADHCDLLIHECTFPEEALELRKKVGIGTFAHTTPVQLGEIAVKANVKSLVATHFAHFDKSSPVVKKFLAKHMPIGLVGPAMIDKVVADIRKNYKGPLHIAHDLMRIDL